MIHSGFWGCGAFGGNKAMMLMLQELAARMAGVERLVLHVMDEAGQTSAAVCSSHVKQFLDVGEVSTPAMIDRVVAMGLRWGVGNGT